MGKLKIVLESVLKFGWKYKFTILTLVFLYLICYSFHSKHNNQFILLILSFFFLLAGLSKTNRIAKWLVTVILALLVAFDAYFGFVIGEHLSFGVLDSILFTNTTEAMGVLSNILLRGGALFVLILFLFVCSEKELKQSGIGKKVAYSIFAIYWLLYVPIYSLSRTCYSKDKDAVDFFEKAPAYSFYLRVGKKFPLIYHNAIIYATYEEQAKEQKIYRTMERTTPEYLTIDTTATTPLKIYIVVGESATRRHFSLYGYSQQTTPFLDSLSKSSHSLHFYDGISSAPLTTMSIPMAFTFATPLDEEPLYKRKNLLELAHGVGYETVWIASQAMLGMADSDISVYSSVATRRHYLGVFPFDDILIVNRLREELRDDSKQMFFLHHEGSHMNYADRYDETDKKAIGGSDIIANYDRTIHHTDRFFEQLYHTIEQDGSPYVVIYFSDHGEVIGKGHGFMNEGISQFEIPFLTMHKGNFPIDSLVSKYMMADSKLVNNLSVINIVSELVGYRFPQENVEQVKEASRYIKHADTNPYLYEELKKGNM